MKRCIVIFSILICSSCMVLAQNSIIGVPSITGTLDMATSIADLAVIAKEKNAKPLLEAKQGSYMLLTGTLGTIVVKSEEPFGITVELLSGAWEGSSKLVLHRVYLRFSDVVFSEVLAKPEGRRIMVIVSKPELRQFQDGSPIILLQALALTRLN